MDVVTLNPGDEISKGTKVAVLADDTRMRLEQYYSYAYAGELKAGQKVQVSIPALMTTVEGTVEAVHMVSRITPEGSKLFSAEIVIPNEGVLAKDMVATATTIVNGDTVYPYEAAKLQYYRVGDLNSTVSGTVISSNLVDYLAVTPGQVLVRIDGEDSETADLHRTAESGRRPRRSWRPPRRIWTTAMRWLPFPARLSVCPSTPGQETPGKQHPGDHLRHLHRDRSAPPWTSGTSAISRPGMPVNLNQWGTSAFGTVETVSLSSTVNNGVASYPITISADNTEGNLQVNSYVNYQIQRQPERQLPDGAHPGGAYRGAGGRFLRHRGLCAGRQPAGQRAWSCPIRTRRSRSGF